MLASHPWPFPSGRMIVPCLVCVLFSRWRTIPTSVRAKQSTMRSRRPPRAISVYSSHETTVPLRSLCRAHADALSDEEEAGLRVEVSASVLAAHSRAFALVVEGNCMDRVIPEDAHVLVDPDREPRNGSIVVAETEAYQAVMRRWHRGNTTLMLSVDSLEDQQDLIFGPDDRPVRVVGTVVWCQAPEEMEQDMAEDDYYAPRSMVAYKLSLNVRGKPEEVVLIDDVCGWHIGDLFESFCNGAVGELSETSGSGKYIRVVSPSRVSGGVLVSLLSGLAGDDRQVFDVTSAEKKYDLGATDAPMVEVRALLSWKDTGRGYALMCVEHSPSAAGDTVLFRPFARYLREVVPDVVMSPEPVIEAEALEAFESLERVEVRRYLGSADITDSLAREGDVVSYVLSHKRGRPFSIKSVVDVVREKANPAVLFGYRGTPFDSDDSRLLVTLRDSRGRKKTFDIFDDYGMKVREELTKPGQRPLSDGDFVAACNDRCETIAERIGRMI